MDELLRLYSKIYHIEFIDRLGEGKDGEVFQTAQYIAVKFLNLLEYFQREVRAYQILSEDKIQEIAGHDCPEFVRADDTLLAIEMTIVQPRLS